MSAHDDEDVEVFGDTGISEYTKTNVPTFLKWVYVFCILFGIYWFYNYFDGSHGWLDRGYWKELQGLANTKKHFSIERKE